MELGLHERVYIVTGGTKGLGRAAAEALVADGARVVVSARTQESVDSAVASLTEYGVAHHNVDAVRGVAADNAAPDTAERLVQVALDTWGQLDGALISVGGPPATAALGATDEQWRTAFESVFLGAVRAARVLVPQLGHGGAIALVLSTTVKEPMDGLEISNGLRPGLALWAKYLADEVGSRGIRVVGLLPGRVLTDRTRELHPDADTRARIAERIPLRRYAEPAEFGKVAAFVLSPAASYVTGCVIPIDGGNLRGL